MKKSIYFIFLIFFACNNNPEEKQVNQPSKKPNEEKSLRDAIQQYPDSFLLKEKLIQYFRDSGNYHIALKEVNHILEKDSLNARLWEIKATLYFENADTVNAIRSFEKAIGIFPDMQTIISLGTLYAQTGNPLAIDMADALLNGYKSTSDKDAYFIKGLYFSYKNEKIKAIVFFDKCLSLNFTFMDAYREKALALYDQGKFTEALAVLDKAITLQNSFDEGYYYSGKCLEKLGRIPEAIQSYKNALLIDPDYIEAKEALLKLGDRS